MVLNLFVRETGVSSYHEYFSCCDPFADVMAHAKKWGRSTIFYELLNKVLQVPGSVPEHGLMQVIDVAESLQVGQGGDRCGFG